jgi:flagellar hook assembly protein FlgD
VQIFTPVGEPVFEKTLDATSTSYNWDAVNDSGEKVASGVYYYLITDDSGHKKKGKLAIVR